MPIFKDFLFATQIKNLTEFKFIFKFFLCYAKKNLKIIFASQKSETLRVSKPSESTHRWPAGAFPSHKCDAVIKGVWAGPGCADGTRVARDTRAFSEDGRRPAALMARVSRATREPSTPARYARRPAGRRRALI